MIVPWLVYCLLISGLVSVAAWLGERASRAQGWAGRWAWAGALSATVGLPVWAWLAPSSGEPAGLAPMPGAYVMEALPPLVLQPGSSAGLTLEGALLLAWAAASAVLLSWLAVSAVRLRAAQRGWGAEELEGVRVLVSERTGPAAMGLIRGRVVLPRWALALDERLRRLMVLHEAEHVRAGDPQLAVAGLLVCALMPWNVAAWWQLRRLRLAIEMDCDARVLRRSDDVRGYGALLLEVGGRRSRLALGLAETKSSLERRIRMMTAHTTGRRTLRALGLAGVSAMVLAVACETPGPTAVADAERRPVEIKDVRSDLAAADGCEPTVYLDGREVSLEDVRAMDEDEIDSIEVFKGAVAADLSQCGVILVHSKNASPEDQARARGLLETLRARMTQTRTPDEIAAAPTFTPMHVRPTLKDAEAVAEGLLRHYPPLLRNAGIGGTTNVWFFIDAEGRVAKTMVNESSGHNALDQAALRVAEGMEFTPAFLDDEPTPVWVALDITFDVKADAEGGEDAGRDRVEAARQATERAARDRREARASTSAPADAATDESRPAFTPMTERPHLKNGAEVVRLLEENYPPLLREAGITGATNVWFHIDAEGRVAKTMVNESSGHPALDEAALRVARQMEFTAARNGDEAVPVWVAMDIKFEGQ